MTNDTRDQTDLTGVDDVRRVRDDIARQHQGNLAEHVLETNRVAERVRERLGLGPIIQPPAGNTPRSGTEV